MKCAGHETPERSKVSIARKQAQGHVRQGARETREYIRHGAHEAQEQVEQ